MQYKTQVFVNHEGDHYRNRLTHSIEVSSIARSLSRELGLSIDLAEAVALAHDLGHSPFGHAGEDALNKCMEKFGGFSHNAHTFKILTLLENKYASYDGLNLTWEVLEGIVKHNGPINKKDSSDYILDYNKQHDLRLNQYSSAESQLASLSDDIAYITHDLEDSFKAGIISYEDLAELEFVDKILKSVRKAYPDISAKRLIYETCRKLTHHLIEDLLRVTKNNFIEYKIENIQDIRTLNKPVLSFSKQVEDEILQVKKFLFEKVYTHAKVSAMSVQCKLIVSKLFQLYVDNIELLPLPWRNFVDLNNKQARMSLIADYIAGMTDRYAIKQYQSFYNINFKNIEL